MNKIGFSHGVLYKIMDTYTKEAFDVYAAAGSEIIEICFAKDYEINKLPSIIPFVKNYSYRSIHLPSNVRYGNNAATKELLTKVMNFYRAISADLALVHPDIVDDWSVFDAFPLVWATENMDNRKRSHKNVDDIEHFFNRNSGWKLVLDLNHCYSNDTSMRLAEELIEKFRDKIAEVHLSGYTKYHEPLYQTKQEAILQFCRQTKAPIIIESTFTSPAEVEKEMDYIKNFLQKNHQQK
jgi:hypothetical protein